MKFQKYFNVEIRNFLSAVLLKDFLRENGIRFEPSGCYDITHFEIFVPDEKTYNKINDFLLFLPD